MNLEKPIAVALVLGSAMVLIGSVPGLLSGLMEGLQDFRDGISPFPTREPRTEESGKRLPGQKWLVAAGVVIILISVLASMSFK